MFLALCLPSVWTAPAVLAYTLIGIAMVCSLALFVQMFVSTSVDSDYYDTF